MVKFIIGGSLCTLASLLNFIPYLGWVFWILISLAPLGYAYAIFGERLSGKSGPLPAWNAWGDYIYRGFFAFLILLVYGIAPGALYGIGEVLWTAGGFAALFGVPFIILGVGIGLAASFLLPMGFAVYTGEGEFFAAIFRWNRIVERIWLVQKEYFTAWVAALALLLALLFLRLHILFLGWILYSFGFFYFLLVAAYLFGEVCREGAAEEL